jgi:hypothetical protein
VGQFLDKDAAVVLARMMNEVESAIAIQYGLAVA